MHAVLVCVVPDGSSPVDGTLTRVALPSEIHWPVGDAGTVTISAIREDGSVYDLAGCTLILSCREHASDSAVAFAVAGVLDPTPQGGTAPGTATFPLTGSTTAATVPGRVYWFDVRMVDADSAAFHIFPPSKWIPQMTIAKSGDVPA